MKVAIVGAGFTPAEADALRRSMATFKLDRRGQPFPRQDDRRHGRARLYRSDFAERTFKQIEGFGSYGFPESHAASFAKIAYASSWMKYHHPDIFCARSAQRPADGLLRARPDGPRRARPWRRGAPGLRQRQPLGLHAGGTKFLPGFAGEGDQAKPGGGVTDQACAMTPPPPSGRSPSPRNRGKELLPLRLGLRMVKGLSNDHGAQDRRPRRWTRPSPRSRTSGAGRACRRRRSRSSPTPTPSRSLGLDRRQALWQVRGLGGDAAAALRLRRGARDGARGGADADDRGPRGGRGLSRRPALAARPSARLPAARARPARHPPLRGAADMKDGGEGPGRRHRPGPPAAGRGQRHLHHARGRDRHRQCDRLAAQLRGAPPDHPRRGDDRRARQAAEGRAGDPRRHRAGSRI